MITDTEKTETNNTIFNFSAMNEGIVAEHKREYKGDEG